MVNSSILSKRWTRPPRWTHPSLVKDGRDHLGRLALLKWWVRFHEVLSVHRRTRLARTLGTFTSPIWFIVACLSLDEAYGRVMELDDFCDTISSMYDFSFDRNKELKGYDFIIESVSDVRLFKRLVLVLKFYLYFYVRFAHCVYPWTKTWIKS